MTATMTRGRRLSVGLTALGTTVLLLLGVALAAVASAARAAEPTSGAGTTVTVEQGPFAGLALSVSQTANLINQVVTVSWTGSQPTVPTSGRFGLHYMQIMQCWGDEQTGPRREQCQYGARVGDGRGGAFVPGRQVNYGDQLVDPLETYTQPEGSSENVHVPFESVTGKTSTGSRSEFFDGSTTNELAFARTRGDGSGSELFELQTSTEAPGLGCGARTTTSARSCYLVAVPRGNTEVDGSTRSGSGANELQSSPLSASNWQHRVVVPLQFEPLGSTCPQTSERRTVGHELVSELITRWQPALCADGGATYGFSQVTDAFARGRLVAPEPGMSFLSRAADPATVPAERPAVYAPVAVQGLSVSFLIERNPVPSAPESERLRGGTAVEDVRLTARLVAKLLTQSYANAVPDRNPEVADNPELLTNDEEFLALNPEFSNLVYTQLSDILVPVGQADVTEQLWAWIDGDAEARAWLDGSPDENGMTVNPAYEGIDLPVADFPKSDPYCRVYPDDRLPLCALERRPYAADLSESGRSAARGDNLARQFWDPLATPPAWRRAEPQPNGSRAVIAVTDTATAHRYGLTPAKLRNRAGEFVAPDEAGVLAGLATMKPGPVAAVLEADPAAVSRAAYPLTTVSYAVTAPAGLTPDEGREYAALLDYAAGPGQTPGVAPGTLPGGYVPLPEPMRVQTRAAADTVRTTAGVPVDAAAADAADAAATVAGTTAGGAADADTADASAPGAAGAASPAGPSSGSGPASPGGGFDGALLAGPAGGSVAGGLDALLGVETDAPAAVPSPDVALAALGRTPGQTLGVTRFWLPAVLLLGIVAGLLGPALTRGRVRRP